MGRITLPAYLCVEPGCQQAPALERFIVSGPVSSIVGLGYLPVHASQLPRWFREMNPSQDLCNIADPMDNIQTFHKEQPLTPLFSALGARLARLSSQ
jgi:hypothetical protein